jgi:3-phenylpropionate/trans-cinnamate dioxygenase ferredoxin subunit
VIITVPVSEVAQGKVLAVPVNEALTLAVLHHEGTFHAVDDKCPHRGARLSEGELAGGLLVCPLHHFKFDLKKAGRCVMPRHLKLRSFPVSREGDQLCIDVKDADVKDAAEPAAGDTAPAGTPAAAG